MTSSTVNVGIVGFGWMGQVHAKALTRVMQHYRDLGAVPRLVAVADPASDGRLDYARDVFGITSSTADWTELVARDDIDLVCVAGPNYTHRDVAVAAAKNGKHIWVEKPAGRNLAETVEIADAVAAAGVASAVGFNYRNAPAVELARKLVAEGRIGEVRHVRVQMLGDYCAHPDGALTWRFVRELAGSGVIGDLASHGLDLAQYVAGPIGAVLAEASTFISERPQAAAAASHFSRGGDGPRLPVENEDHVLALLRFTGGARGVLEASRASVGEQNSYAFEVHGSTGALAWDFRRTGELQVCLDQDYQGASWSTHRVGPSDGEAGAFQPDTAIPLSFDDLKVVEAKRLLTSIATGRPEGATIADMVSTARLVDATLRSDAEQRWVTL
ncbi:Gfo/Idh/MocA family protein [Kineosporia sp. A_224]|uniref:Gfo/Idh/MocA family protein n=1 Tax=Kineosporia sp. A_224 TaxID=1962180 RepID=UPI000B4B282F|nr:Gfo/Idh/MocA family oxidoreductase [Kineosporia sp. A_224]